MNLCIQNIQYLPNRNRVAILVEFEDVPGTFYINVREDELPDAWTDTDVLAAAQVKLDTDPANELGRYGKKGHTIVLPQIAPAVAAEITADRAVNVT